MLSSDMSIERMAKAHAKNRVEYSNLSTQLHRIEREKQMEMKMLNTEKLKFKAKYFKTSEASDVKMYETHTPGFCFRRNGEKRVPQPLPSTPSVDFNHLQFLLFTNGEVDIEKVLCLHLLSSHETKHLRPPRRLRGSSSGLKKDSPLEQLIERSKEESIESGSSTVLPTYVLDVNKQNVHRQMEEDERLASRLIVNEKISELIRTVIRALEQANPEKVEEMLSIAFDRGSLKRIFKKPHIQDFVLMLKENSLVNSCSSFVLSRREPDHVEIRTPSGVLEDLVRFVRANVLQFRNRSSFAVVEQESVVRNVVEDGPAPLKRTIDVRRISSPRVGGEIARREPPRVEDVEVEIVNPFRRTAKNFIAKNIEAVARYKRDEEEPGAAMKRPKRRQSVEQERRGGRAASFSREPRSSRSSSRRSSDEVKVHSKQTTCPACMERWKIPLPPPKVSKLTKSAESSAHSVEAERSSDLQLKTGNVQQRISVLIHKEQFKLDSYDRRYSNASSVSGSDRGRRRSDSSRSDSVDQMDLNVFDLEKIRQEIREKETKKKLEKFLGA